MSEAVSDYILVDVSKEDLESLVSDGDETVLAAAIKRILHAEVDLALSGFGASI
jgi:hypothetical protein